MQLLAVMLSVIGVVATVLGGSASICQRCFFPRQHCRWLAISAPLIMSLPIVHRLVIHLVQVCRSLGAVCAANGMMLHDL